MKLVDLDFPMPEMVFGENFLELACNGGRDGGSGGSGGSGGFSIRFSTKEALQGCRLSVQGQGGGAIGGGGALSKVPCQ